MKKLNKEVAVMVLCCILFITTSNVYAGREMPVQSECKTFSEENPEAKQIACEIQVYANVNMVEYKIIFNSGEIYLYESSDEGEFLNGKAASHLSIFAGWECIAIGLYDESFSAVCIKDQIQ